MCLIWCLWRISSEKPTNLRFKGIVLGCRVKVFLSGTQNTLTSRRVMLDFFVYAYRITVCQHLPKIFDQTCPGVRYGYRRTKPIMTLS